MLVDRYNGVLEKVVDLRHQCSSVEDAMVVAMASVYPKGRLFGVEVRIERADVVLERVFVYMRPVTFQTTKHIGIHLL